MHENRETSGMPAGQEDGRPAGEGDCHTARVYIAEGSDSAIVPMSLLNKDGKPLAEMGEGRALIKENTHQPKKSPTQSGTRVSQGLEGVRKAARESNVVCPKIMHVPSRRLAALGFRTPWACQLKAAPLLSLG